MAKTKSSKSWLKEHFDDSYVKRAQQEGYRSRAVYKLIEINDKDHILKPNMTVVDLGAAPGGWSQYLSQKLGDSGRIFALDILPMDGFADVDFIQGDFLEQAVYEALIERLQGQAVDLVLSDMAPNISGVRAVDQPRAMYLAELALDFASSTLKKGGVFLVKVFQGEGFDEYLAAVRQKFAKVQIRKPKASRPRSREVYLLARHYT